MQTALQPIRLFCFILALSCQYQHLWARCALVFQYKGQTQFMIDDSGNVIDARIIQNAADATPDEALIIEKNHQLMLWAHDNHVFIPGALHEYTDTAAYPNTGLQFKTNELGYAAELTETGDLYISGKETVRQPTAMVTYVDNSAVYELNADKVNELQYHHLTTPYGNEGRIFADNHTEFYVKDHLGSVRSVIAERPNGQGYEVVEYTSYYHYGSIKDALERPGQVREKFTGKEFDEDGQGNGSPGLQLYYFGARFYDPVVGVWIGVDPAGQFSTPYAYAGNGYNPINGVDPQGLWMDSGEKGKEARDKGISARLDRGERAGVNDDKGHIGAQFTEAERVAITVSGELKKYGEKLIAQAAALRAYNNQLIDYAIQWSPEKFYNFMEGNWKPIGSSGFLEGLAPVWGPLRNAINDFQVENYKRAAFNAALAASEAVGIGYGIKNAFRMALGRSAVKGLTTSQKIGMLRDAAKYKGNFGIGQSNLFDAMELGQSWVGPGYRIASDGKILISKNGLRQFRPPSFKPHLGKIQANFEWRLKGQTQWFGNAHLDIIK